MSAFLSPAFLSDYKNIAVGLSGGPDSLALTHMLSTICAENNLNTHIHVLTVDHNLRPEAKEEAATMAYLIKNFPNASHHILTWQHAENISRVMEEARNARYDLMAEYCKQENIELLYIAHHLDDQAETFLFRLAKGSGLDGLCGMQAVYAYSDHLKIIRPLLDHTKAELISYCEKNKLPYIDDPSNYKITYARPRLRQSQKVLSEEGLTNKRLSITAKRLNRARDTLLWLTERAISKVCEQQREKITINLNALSNYPEEIRLRVLQKMIDFLAPDTHYTPRFEKIESLCEDLFKEQPFRKQTFSHIIFEKKKQGEQNTLIMTKEI